MADYSQIIEQINANIVPENNARLITGRKLNNVLREMIAAVNSTKNDNIEGVEYLALVSGINAELVQKYNAYQNSIDYNAGRITAEVNRATNAEGALGSRIDGVASGLQDEAQRASGAEEALGGRITTEVGSEKARAELAESLLNGRIDTIIASSDLKDIVGTYADLMTYDKTTLGDNDIIEVLTDETHQNTTSFYRYIASSDSFAFVGSYAATYTKTEIDDLLSNLNSLVETKMKQVPLTRDTDGIKDKAGNVLNYEAVKALVEDETNFVYLVDARVLHIPAFINEPEDEGAIEFAASFIFGDRVAIHRVIINSANEVKVNQVNVEHESDKLATGTLVHRYETNADKYPSVKALVEYLTAYYQEKGNYLTSDALASYYTKSQIDAMKQSPITIEWEDGTTSTGCLVNQ